MAKNKNNNKQQSAQQEPLSGSHKVKKQKQKSAQQNQPN